VKKISVTAAGVLLAAMACGAASAQEAIPTGSATYDTSAVDSLPWYVSGKVGVALPGTIDTHSVNGFGVGPSGKSTFDAGFAGSVAVGKYFTQQVRAELELGLATNAGRSFEGTYPWGAPSSGPLDGNVTTTTVMVVGYYDFTQLGDFVPYLSAGLGGAHVNSDLTYTDNTGFSSGTITGSSLVLAARIGAGFQYKIADSINLTVDYAALFGGEASLTHQDPFGLPASTVTSNVMGHALAIGLKGSF
jgi:opacity protein-like surface antigen